MDTGCRKRFLVFFACAFGVSLSAFSVFAQAPQPKISDLYAAVREEDYERVKTLAPALGNGKAGANQQAALLLYGRALLGCGDFAEAEPHLKKLAGLPLDNSGKLQLRVYGAWLAALKGEHEAAVKTLDEILAAQAPVEATAEAAEVLSRIHAARGGTKAAAQAVGFGRQFLAYQKINSEYLEALFRRRLANPAQLPKDQAEALFNQAESLRLKGKTPAALALYEKLIKEHATSPWADPSGFRLGECLLLSGKGPQARKHWEDFVHKEPRGPWRAQAYIALADISLEYDFDPAAALTVMDSAARILEGGVEDAAKDSWASATFDVHLRRAAAATLSEKYADAAESFRAAKTSLTGQAESASGIEQLVIITAEKRQPVPKQVLGGACGSLLTLARIYNAAGIYQKASPICSRLIKGDVRSCSAAQKAYAFYEQAYGLDHTKKLQDALRDYLLSLKTYREGAWHDDTLFRAAMLTQELASKLAAPTVRSAGAKVPAANAGTPAERARQREQRRQEKSTTETARFQGRVEALPLWAQLIDSFPDSRHREAALYFAGLLYFETARPSESLEHLGELVKRHPDSAYAGDAHVKLADVCIESLLDLKAAKAAVHDGLHWLEGRRPLRAGLSIASTVGSQARPDAAIEFDLRIRSGLVAYLENRPADAIAEFESARPFEPARKLVVVSGHVPGAVERLVSAAKTGKPLVPPEVEVGDKKAGLCLRIASLYYEAEEFDHSMRLCNNLLDSMPKATRDQRSWAYFLRGRCLHAQQLPLDAMDSFANSVDETSKPSWKPTALFYMANATFNYDRDVETAIAIWQRVSREFPESTEAECSQYYIAFALMHSGRHKAARQAFDEFLKARPDSVYAEPIRIHHFQRLDELETEQKAHGSTKGQQ
jgi:tetratricopeptide (TPR) repeat protein